MSTPPLRSLVAFGDSLCAGQFATDLAHGFYNILAAALDARYPGIVCRRAYGAGGGNIQQLRAAIELYDQQLREGRAAIEFYTAANRADSGIGAAQRRAESPAIWPEVVIVQDTATEGQDKLHPYTWDLYREHTLAIAEILRGWGSQIIWCNLWQEHATLDDYNGARKPKTELWRDIWRDHPEYGVIEAPIHELALVARNHGVEVRIDADGGATEWTCRTPLATLTAQGYTPLADDLWIATLDGTLGTPEGTSVSVAKIVGWDEETDTITVDYTGGQEQFDTYTNQRAYIANLCKVWYAETGAWPGWWTGDAYHPTDVGHAAIAEMLEDVIVEHRTRINRPGAALRTSDVQVFSTSTTSVTVTWPGAAPGKIERQEHTGSAWSASTDLTPAAGASAYTDTGLTAGKVYRYRIGGGRWFVIPLPKQTTSADGATMQSYYQGEAPTALRGDFKCAANMKQSGALAVDPAGVFYSSSFNRDPTSLKALVAPNGANAITITDPGSGYPITGGAQTIHNNVPLTGGSGTGAQAKVTVSAAQEVTAVELTAVGRGYTTGAGLPTGIDLDNGAGTDAVIACNGLIPGLSRVVRSAGTSWPAGSSATIPAQDGFDGSRWVEWASDGGTTASGTDTQGCVFVPGTNGNGYLFGSHPTSKKISRRQVSELNLNGGSGNNKYYLHPVLMCVDETSALQAAVALKTAGTGYPVADTVHEDVVLTGSTGGSGAKARVTVKGDQTVKGAVITTLGADYSEGDTPTGITLGSGINCAIECSMVDSENLDTEVEVVDGGSGYTVVDEAETIHTDVPLSGGSGTGAKGSVTVSVDQEVTAVTITTLGSGYSTAGGMPTGLELIDHPTLLAGEGCVIACSMAPGDVLDTAVTIVTPGTGYPVSADPTVHTNVPLTGGSGTGAKGTVTVAATGVPATVEITAAGTGYRGEAMPTGIDLDNGAGTDAVIQCTKADLLMATTGTGSPIFNGWSCAYSPTRLVIGGYHPDETGPNNYLYVSDNYALPSDIDSVSGATTGFKPSFTKIQAPGEPVTEAAPNARNNRHVHGVLYNPVSDRWFVSVGDTYKRLYMIEGSSWTEESEWTEIWLPDMVRGYRMAGSMTGMTLNPVTGDIFFGSDETNGNGVYRISADGTQAKQVLRLPYSLSWGQCWGIACYPDGEVWAAFPDRGSSFMGKTDTVWCSTDNGETWRMIYKWPNAQNLASCPRAGTIAVCGDRVAYGNVVGMMSYGAALSASFWRRIKPYE